MSPLRSGGSSGGGGTSTGGEYGGISGCAASEAGDATKEGRGRSWEAITGNVEVILECLATMF